MSEHDPADRYRPRGTSTGTIVAIIVALLIGGGFAWWRWSQQPADTPPAVATQPPEAPPDAPAQPEPAPPEAAAEPEHPVDQAEAALEPSPDADRQVQAALTELLGRKSVLTFLQVDDFVRRFVATVDNLPRERATSRLWPVHPIDQRFLAQGAGGEAQTIHPDNDARYTAFVLFAESVDPAQAAALYRKIYPLLQRAYEELGYPGRYFNDRLVAVIDHLLQAPEPSGPVPVKLVEVRGEVPSQQPWVRYEYADPDFESMSAGHKILVRVGPVNERRLKARLAAFRQQIVQTAPKKP